jgi:hypothetical protein
VDPVGTWSIGVFNPLRWVPTENLEVSTHPLVAVGSPNVLGRYDLDLDPQWTVAIEAGLSVPWATFSSPLPLGLQGFFYPSCQVSTAEPERGDTCREPTAHIVPRAGVVASFGTHNVWTLRLDSAVGIPLGDEDVSPTDAWPYLDLLLAPVSTGHRSRLLLRYDHELTGWLRFDVEAAGLLVGAGSDPERNPVVLYGHLGADLKTSAGTRLTLGVAYWNSDQHQRELTTDADGFSEWEDVRTHDLAPTIDFIWVW